MGKPDLFAKRTFVEDAVRVTRGAASWRDAPEIGLERVVPDGMLVVHRATTLKELCPPWCLAAPHDEVLVELKMQGDHIARTAVARALLRRQAREVQRIELVKPKESPWMGHEPLWLVSGYLPQWVVDLYDPKRVTTGCYRVFDAPFEFMWIVANELPLQDELVPFLLTRTGKPLAAFARWVLDRKPLAWVMDMLGSFSMFRFEEPAVQRKLKEFENDPEAQDNLVGFARYLLQIPWLHERLCIPERPQIPEEEVKRAVENDIMKGELREARDMLRRVLTLRQFIVSAERQAQIDACDELEALHRWHDNAVLAKSTDDVFT